jgi:hypothetical protein
MPTPWLGVDLDGTLAFHTPGASIVTIGPPIPRMLKRVQRWLADGRRVKIVTARVGNHTDPDLSCSDQIEFVANQRFLIQDWCRTHLGRELEITHGKDLAMLELWDDRAVQVVPNTGLRVDGVAL